MKIAVFGYYHALNAGDDRIQQCMTRLLQDHSIIFLPHYLPPPQEILETMDWILIGGGGLIFDRVGIWVNLKQWLRSCKARIGVLGIGVNRVSPKLLEDVQALINASAFFYVRDDISKQLLLNHPKIDVFPDITWIFPLQAETLEMQSSGIALNLAPCSWRSFAPELWVKELNKFQINPFPLNFKRNRDFDLLQGFFGQQVPQEFSINPLLKSRFLIACRYHAIVFAMQLGIPFLAINYDDKVKRLLLAGDLVDCCLETTEHESIGEKIDYLINNQSLLQQKISNFTHQQTTDAAQLVERVDLALANHPQNQPSFFQKLKHTIKPYVSFMKD